MVLSRFAEKCGVGEIRVTITSARGTVTGQANSRTERDRGEAPF